MKKPFILIILGIILYSFSLFNGFVWDDEVMRDTQLSAGHSYFRPVMTAVNGTLFTVFGSQPFFFHLISVIFHIATAVLLLYLFKRFFDENIAFFLSLLFLVHPANVEAVCFASALQEVLFTFTGVLGLYLFVIPAEAGIQPQNINLKKDHYPLDSRVRGNDISPITILGAIILSATALLMKETGIVFFVLIFCYLILFHRKNTSVIQLYVAFAIIAVFTYGIARLSNGNVYVQNQGLFPIMRVPLEIRLMNIPMIILYYMGMFFFPFNLGIAQHWVVRTMDFWHFWLPICIDVGLITLIVFVWSLCHSRERGNLVENHMTDNHRLDPRLRGGDKHIFIFFFLWFLIGLLPHLQLIPLNMTVAERWLYFSQIGLLGMVGSLCHSERSEESSEAKKDSSYVLKSLRMTIGIIIILLFFSRSFVRTLDWRNGLTLYGHDITRTSSFDLQNNLGVELFRIGKYAQAKKYFEISTRLAPYWWVNWNNLGASYEREQNFVKAQECYERSIQNGQYGLAYENLAKILVLHGTDKKKAEEFLKKALQLFPESETLQMLQKYNPAK